MTTLEVYGTSNGELTRNYYKDLSVIGPIGIVAMNLFRAQKCSVRAKAYRRGSWTADAYQRKQYSMEELCKCLMQHGQSLSIPFGWKQDPNVVFSKYYGDENPEPSWVLYIDLPTGQVSFHTKARCVGPDYPGQWDGEKGASEKRVLEFCDYIFTSNGKNDQG